MDKNKNKYMVKKSDLLLYVLSRIQPRASTKLVVNKLAFFAEFGFKYKTGNNLSDAQYAGIDHGPVIDGYSHLLNSLERKGMIQIKNNNIFLTSQPPNIPANVKEVIDSIIDKYSKLSSSELRALSHATDSYILTTKGEKKMGKIIDKELAALETIFDEENDEIHEDELPPIEPQKLVKYEHN